MLTVKRHIGMTDFGFLCGVLNCKMVIAKINTDINYIKQKTMDIERAKKLISKFRRIETKQIKRMNRYIRILNEREKSNWQ